MHYLETQDTTSATGKTNCAVLESCFTSPLTCTSQPISDEHGIT